MRDALAMRGIQRLQNLPGVFDSFLQRKRTLQRRSFDELHNQVIRSDIVKLADVRIIQSRDRTRLGLEPLRELLLRDLDRDDAIKPRVAGFIELAHAPSAN